MILIRQHAPVPLSPAQQVYAGLGTVPMGAGTMLSNIVNSGVSVGTGVATSAIAGTSLAAGLATAGITAGLSLAITGVVAWISSIQRRGKQKVASTNIVNEVSAQLDKVKAAYDASAHTYADWMAANDAIQQLYAFTRSSSGCGNPELGSAGQRCISERMCKGGDPGCRWPWFDYYDLGPRPDPPAAAAGGGALGGAFDEAQQILSGGVAGVPLILIAGGLLLAFGLMRR